MNKKIIIMTIGMLLLAGCGFTSKQHDIPKYDAAGQDDIKLSPCACKELEYHPVKLEFVS